MTIAMPLRRGRALECSLDLNFDKGERLRVFRVAWQRPGVAKEQTRVINTRPGSLRNRCRLSVLLEKNAKVDAPDAHQKPSQDS